MSDIDPTPESPVTIPDRLGWFRGDMAARFDALRGIGLKTLSDLVDSVQSLMGPPSNRRSLHDIDMKLSEIHGGIDNLALTNGFLIDIREQLRELQETIGAGAYASTETANIRAILMAIMNAQSTFGIQPTMNGTTVGGVGTLAIDGWRYVVWDTYDGIGYDETRTQIHRANGGWDGWKVYIKTDAPSA